jgi:type IV pilus assembly protein PilC
MILTGVFTFIIPQFGTVLTEMTEGKSLPALTRLFLSMAGNVGPFWLTAGCIIAAIVVLLAGLSASSAGRRFKESVFLHMPVIGRVYHSSVLSRMAEAMAIMVAAGCDMPLSLGLSSGATGSEKLILESEALAAQIEQGANILEAGQFCRMIPRLFLYSVQLGTQRNELQDNLYSLGQMYTEQARCGQARLQAALLPVLLIVVGGFLALTILSMFLPMISVLTTLSSSA